ncbi:MAG: diguanylate cyclase [Bacillota bacterium]|jgi:diguanylate cyclase (GGDEF)-like protein/putative nucleotidyltransferase with HDIG domain
MLNSSCGSRLSGDRLTALLNAIDLGVLFVDSMDCVAFANAKAVAILGYNQEKVVGSQFRGLMENTLTSNVRNPGDLLQWLDMADAALNVSMESLLLDCELEYISEDLTLNLKAIPIKGKDSDFCGKMVAIGDVSGLRRAEKVLELVSDAAREMNSDLRIGEMLHRLLGTIQDRILADGMAIIWTADEQHEATLLEATPRDFLGGAGTKGLLTYSTGAKDLIVDIVADVARSLEQAPEIGEQVDSIFSKAFLERLHKSEMKSMIALPLKVFGSTSGIWVIASREGRSYAHSDMAFLEPISEHLAVAVNNAILLHRTRTMYSAAVRALAATVDIRDTYTMNHSENVSAIAGIIAAELGLPKEEIEVIELAGLVHDIGKVGIPDAILNKPGPLASSERAVMTNHSVLGAKILERAGMLSDLAPMVLHHHEWHNGSGYPARLRGSQIPTGAAILAVADAFDTMISDRVYKNSMSLDSARQELLRCAGGQFDPAVVKALDRALGRALENDEGWLRAILGVAAVSPYQGTEQNGPRTLAEQEGGPGEAISSKELSVMFRITQEMRKLLDLNDLLNHILFIVSIEMHYSDCAILLLDENGENLVLSAGMGMSQKVLGLKIPKGSGVSWWVMRHGVPQNVPDVGVDERYYEGTPEVASEVYVPLEVRGKRLGVLLVQKGEKHGFTPNDVRLLMAVAGHIASALEVAQLHGEVKKAAETDSLTGLHNRRSTVHALERLIADAETKNGPGQIGIVLLDVDGLKQINDCFGHLSGDNVLVRIADCLLQGFRSCDVVGRFGGDEFIVLLPGVSAELAESRISDVISVWRQDKIKSPSGKEIRVPGASFGVSCYPFDGTEARVLITEADNRLLAAKARTHARLY